MPKTIKTKYYSTYATVNDSITVYMNELFDYYVIQNHRIEDTARKLKISTWMVTHLMNHWNLKKPKSLSHYWNKDTCLKKYGDPNYNNAQKNKETCLERYGVDNQFKRIDKVKEWHKQAFGYEAPAQHPEIRKTIFSKLKNKSEAEKEKIRLKKCDTCLQRYGVPYVMQNKEIAKKNSSAPGKYEKTWNTKK